MSPSTIPRDRWHRIIPVAFLMYTIAFIDRNNIGFAFTSMQHDLAIDATYTGAAAGIFFLGYVFLQIPAAVIAEKWGAKRFVTASLFAWGIISMATGLVHSGPMLLVARFLLGVAEGGVSPAAMILLTKWFPIAERSRANAYWYLCIPFASIIVSPICGWILTVANWRVMFLAEGLPAIIFAAVWWRFIDDDPTQAKWLSGSEKAYLVDTLSAERAAIREPSEAAGGNRSSRVWILVAVFFLIQVGFYGYSLWLPTLIKSISASSDLTVGFISALPWVAGAVGSIAMARYADRTGERRKCVVVATIGGATFLSLSVLLGREHPILAIAAMVFCMGFLFSYIGVFWSIPSTFLTGLGLSTGLGTINALGNLGGFIGPSVVGYLITTTHQFLAGISFLAATLVGAGVLMSLLPVPSRQPDQLSRGHS